jgi:ABC-type iron transport system FetAB permease component
MHQPRKSWEGTILFFVILTTILLGIGFNLGYIYKFAVPWLAIIIVSAVVALAARYWPRRSAATDPEPRNER